MTPLARNGSELNCSKGSPTAPAKVFSAVPSGLSSMPSSDAIGSTDAVPEASPCSAWGTVATACAKPPVLAA
ncbi:hypothetical protein C1Y40_04760 [Mycobacterium talmoniae]|uniref:Uncharacterized protein n=1 Tax=Mycobacterium talmoniae TaxID=1858794 RepID=A0A2S8BEJ3_9MYCO|nr:hypothetical protein C1Y40_04760 [Mycobacterium talmoniae]